MADFQFGPNGITGGGRQDVLGDWELIWSQNSFSLTTSAQTIFSQRTSADGTFADLASGTYLLGLNLDVSPWYSSKHIGLVRWYAGETNGGNAFQIPLHASGHAFNGHVLYARTQQNSRGSNTDLRLQVWANQNSTCNIQAYMKRIG